MNPSSPLSNERHDVYMSNKRSNSLTSFNSYNSTSNMSTISTANHSVPRGNSTNDLLFMESRFTKPSRSKLQHYQHHPNVQNGYVIQPRPLPRASSVPSIPQFSIQNGQRPSMPKSQTQQLYPNLRPSTSMNHIPAYRRNSLKSNHIQMNGVVGVNSPHSSYTQPSNMGQKRRHSAKPTASFTFPNGEVYTPRNKQRGSQTSLANLHRLQTAKHFQGGMQSSPSLVSPPLSFSASQQHITSVRPPQQHAHSISSSATPTTAITTPTTSPPATNVQTAEQDLSLLTTGSNSYSSSPSPSRTSRTNSSVNESTPPSSIDDLTIHTTNKADLSQLPPPLQHFEVTPPNNLGKIEEHAAVDQEVKTTTSTPTSESTQKTLEAQAPIENTTIENSVNNSKETLNLQEDVDPKEPDPVYLENVKECKDAELSTPSPVPVSASVSSSPAPEIKFQTVPKTQVKSSPAPVVLQTPLTSKLASKVSSVNPNTKVERKQSLLKRIFSKVFSSDKKKSKSIKRKNDEKVEVKTPHFNPPAKRSHPNEVVKESQQVKPVTTPSVAVINTSHTLDPEVGTSDVFSFVDGDEDGGIKVNTPEEEEHDSDSSDFKSELVLDKLFSRLSTNEPSEQVYKNIADEKKKRKEEPKSQKTDKKVPVPTPVDDEDEIIQFDDMELIDKIIEFGETPFPDLASTDLGQSQRKLQRSKSIERKKSIRSISSSSARQLDDVITQSVPAIFVSKQPNLEVIYSNQPKDPFPLIQSRPSILKKKSLEITPSTKKVGFTNQIFVNNTYPSYVYNRHSRSLSSYSLSPQLIHQIRHELNDFKRSMTVHEMSKGNTHYFRA